MKFSKNVQTIHEDILLKSYNTKSGNEHVASPARQEIRKRNNILKYLEKWEIFLSFAFLSAVWLLFGQNPIEIIVDKIFVQDFAEIVTKQLINK